MCSWPDTYQKRAKTRGICRYKTLLQDKYSLTWGSSNGTNLDVDQSPKKERCADPHPRMLPIPREAQSNWNDVENM